MQPDPDSSPGNFRGWSCMDSCIPRRAKLRLLHITLEGIVITRKKPEKTCVHEEFVTTKLLLIKNAALSQCLQIYRRGLSLGHARINYALYPAVRLDEQGVDQFATVDLW